MRPASGVGCPTGDKGLSPETVTGDHGNDRRSSERKVLHLKHLTPGRGFEPLDAALYGKPVQIDPSETRMNTASAIGDSAYPTIK
jgi:hypothetical protein